jgi:hypothetical protein
MGKCTPLFGDKVKQVFLLYLFVQKTHCVSSDGGGGKQIGTFTLGGGSGQDGRIKRRACAHSSIVRSTNISDLAQEENQRFYRVRIKSLNHLILWFFLSPWEHIKNVKTRLKLRFWSLCQYVAKANWARNYVVASKLWNRPLFTFLTRQKSAKIYLRVIRHCNICAPVTLLPHATQSGHTSPLILKVESKPSVQIWIDWVNLNTINYPLLIQPTTHSAGWKLGFWEFWEFPTIGTSCPRNQNGGKLV